MSLTNYRNNGRIYEYLQLDPDNSIITEEQKTLACEKLLKLMDLIEKEYDLIKLTETKFKKSPLMALVPMEVS